jgi:hypothetical protein
MASRPAHTSSEIIREPVLGRPPLPLEPVLEALLGSPEAEPVLEPDPESVPDPLTSNAIVVVD